MKKDQKIFTANGHTDILCTKERAIIGDIEVINYYHNEYGGIAGEVVFQQANFNMDKKFDITIVRNHKNEMIILKDVELLCEYGVQSDDEIIPNKKYVFIAKKIL